jgi:recombination protein RecA
MNLQKLRDQLQDKYGTDSVMFCSEIPVRPPVSSGSLALDFAVGGGLPSDRVIEVAGPEGCGKSSLGLLSMKNFLDNEPTRGALILDTEHKLTASWVEQLIGAERMERVLLVWPDDAEQATDIYTQAVSSGEVSFVLYDSIGGSPGKNVTEKSAEIAIYGGNAQAITRFAKLASTHSQKYNCLTFGVNQTRQDMSGYNRHSTPGGNGWKHACVLRIQLKKGKGVIEDKVNGEAMPVGHQVVAKVIKNSLAPAGRTAHWWFFNVDTKGKYPFGIDVLDEIVRLSVLTGIVEQKGGWYYHKALQEGKINGRDSLTEAVKNNPELHKLLVREVMEVLAIGGEVASRVAPISDPDAPLEVEDVVREWGVNHAEAQ